MTSAARPYLRRLETLFTKLFRMQIDGPNGLFLFQLDLLELQRDIQKAIRKTKAAPRSQGKAAVLAGLRAALWDARRFGDAFAWLLLHSERQVIYPLADNPQRVAVPPKDDAWLGFEAVVAHLGGRGLGFPLLHDITDTLRIGDVTFIVPGEPHATAEIKTHLTGSEPTEQGRKLSYEVTAIWAVEEPPARVRKAAKGTTTLPDQQVPARRRHPTKPSIGRQLRRLRKAELLRAAGDGDFIEHEEGDPSLTVFGPGYKGDSYWPVLRRLAREARRNDCATAAVEDTILWVAVHRADGLEGADVNAMVARVPEDLLASGILWTDPEMRGANLLETFQVPELTGTGPQLFLPYFLYPLQRWALLDILHGRLAFMAVVNMGRVAQAIADRGLEVEVSGRDLTVITTVDRPDGSRYRAGVGGLGLHVTEMVMEAKPLDYVVSIAVTMAEAARTNLPRALAG